MMWSQLLPIGYGLMLNLFVIPPSSLAGKQRVVQSLSELEPSEVRAIGWIKTFTVPNTRDINGKPWTAGSLPSALTKSNVYTNSIKPSAWAAGIVTSFSIFESIFICGDFYKKDSTTHLNDEKCQYFQYPARSPPRSNFPIEIFTYNFCQGDAGSPDSAKDNYGKVQDCSCGGECPGQLIGPNQNCYGDSWQNGIFGMEQLNVAFLQAHIEHDNVMKCFPQRKRVAADQLSSTCADLVSMWLTRNHLVALTLGLTDNLTWFWSERLNMVKLFANYYNS